MGVGMAFFAGVLSTFYYSRFYAHSKDDQTWITRHGQQPGNPVHPFTGSRLVLTSNYIEAPRGPAMIPLPDNDDNRGSEGVVGRVMSAVAGRGLHPDGKQPEHPKNIQVPPQQRVNAAHSHFYTKNIPFDVKAWNRDHRPAQVQSEEVTFTEKVSEKITSVITPTIQEKISETLEQDTQVA